MQSACVVDVVDEVWQICRDIIEGFIFRDIDGFDLLNIKDMGFHL